MFSPKNERIVKTPKNDRFDKGIFKSLMSSDTDPLSEYVTKKDDQIDQLVGEFVNKSENK